MNYRAIALVGYMGSGKGVLAEMLIKRGFIPFSGGDVLRGISSGYRPNERMPLIELGNKVREEFGADFIVRVGKLLVEDSPSGSKFVFDSLRNPAEIGYLKREMGALVIEVKASAEIRFARVLERNKPGDPKTWEGFQEIENIDHGIGQLGTGQNILGCVELADVWIDNEDDYEDPEVRRRLEGQLDEILLSNGFIESPRSIEGL